SGSNPNSQAFRDYSVGPRGTATLVRPQGLAPRTPHHADTVRQPANLAPTPDRLLVDFGAVVVFGADFGVVALVADARPVAAAAATFLVAAFFVAAFFLAGSPAACLAGALLIGAFL